MRRFAARRVDNILQAPGGMRRVDVTIQVPGG
jgi:hypothetical protein